MNPEKQNAPQRHKSHAFLNDKRNLHPANYSKNNILTYKQPTAEQIEEVQEQLNELKGDFKKKTFINTLLDAIDRWEIISTREIRSRAYQARITIEQLEEHSMTSTSDAFAKLSKELSGKLKPDKCTMEDIHRWKKELDECEKQYGQLYGTKIAFENLSEISLITIKNRYMNVDDISRSPLNDSDPDELSIATDEEDVSSQAMNLLQYPEKHISPMIAANASQRSAYRNKVFGINTATDPNVVKLFENLKFLAPMDKTGSMSGKCDRETTQMESFLEKTFHFENIPNKYIVHGVKSFRIGKPVMSMKPTNTIYFPNKSVSKSFKMTVQEIIDWQRSFRVYADQTRDGMHEEFLRKALKGKSQNGPEAFRMKFVIRISKCPILMEFDGRIIERELHDDWPHRIKLVSVTGVDFAGRIHDVDDIRTYIENWEEVYVIDPKSNMPRIRGGRDFYRKSDGPLAKLKKERLLNDLIRMARLRLDTCDREDVEIVVETGIGLGVFAGRGIGIDQEVRELSASAIRKVLEDDGSHYKNIRAVVFALPIFDERNVTKQEPYYIFNREFRNKGYTGRIPVFIADQDMHRLTVAIAREGFNVSELNPADSHGVFGEYWQNRGPAVEEKLALTTVGLLVQHHLINESVLNPVRYQLVELK